MSDTRFDTLIDRRNTASQKWERYRDTDILPMWVADTDFMAPPGIIEALKNRIDHGVFGYTHAPQALVDTVTSRMHAQYQ